MSLNEDLHILHVNNENKHFYTVLETVLTLYQVQESQYIL